MIVNFTIERVKLGCFLGCTIQANIFLPKVSENIPKRRRQFLVENIPKEHCAIVLSVCLVCFALEKTTGFFL